MQPISELLTQQMAGVSRSARLLVAYSGGVDSTVLLHALVHTNIANPVVAIHVNHQLSGDAQRWQTHCERFAKALGIKLVCERVDVRGCGQGIENAARQARYAVFERHIQAGDWLLCGHHQADQLETVLYRLMRGSGVAGLAGIAPQRPFAGGLLVRPLLGVSKEQVLEYAHSHKLDWVEDDSNGSDEFDRNFLRNHIVPLLIKRWPNAPQQGARAAQHLSSAQSLLDEYASVDLNSLLPRKERVGLSIKMPKADWSTDRTNQLLRLWFKQCGLQAPQVKQLEQIQGFLNAPDDSQPQWVLGRCTFRRYKGRIYCLPALDEAPWEPMLILSERTVLPDGSVLEISSVPEGTFEVRFRTQAVRVHPRLRPHSQTLKKVLQEVALEPWLRSRVPLIYNVAGQPQELVAVGDLWLEHGAAGAPLEGRNIRWYYPEA